MEGNWDWEELGSREVEMAGMVVVWGREVGGEVDGFWALRWFWGGGEKERIMERDSIGEE